MLSLTRTAPKRVISTSLRTFAQVINSSPSTSSSNLPTAPSKKASSGYPTLEQRIPVKEDHGLYAFFRRKEGANLAGDARFEVVESPETSQVQTGRAWKASELRLKSFRDLHTLWYVGLRERNLLATQKEEARRMGVTNPAIQVSTDKIRECRKTMARIKAVLNERRLAYEGAAAIVTKAAEDHHDVVVLQQLKEQRARLVKDVERRGRIRPTFAKKAVLPEKENTATAPHVPTPADKAADSLFG